MDAEPPGLGVKVVSTSAAGRRRTANAGLQEEHRRLSAEVERLGAELARADSGRLALERDLERSRRLADRGLAAAGLAHDFNNLLQIIVGHAAIALEGLPGTAPAHSALQRLLTAANRAADLSRGLARWDRDEKPAPRPVDVNEVVTEVLDLLADSAPAQVEEARELAPGLPHLSAHPSDVRRIVLNLVLNSWQAIGTDRGRVRVATGAAAGPGGPLVWVEVEDDGPGLTDEARQRVFEPFYTTRECGSGVGLPCVSRLVERWGGRIEVWSVRGQGARFRVSLPADPDSAPPGN
jgi:hypothetical protein